MQMQNVRPEYDKGYMIFFRKTVYMNFLENVLHEFVFQKTVYMNF